MFKYWLVYNKLCFSDNSFSRCFGNRMQPLLEEPGNPRRGARRHPAGLQSAFDQAPDKLLGAPLALRAGGEWWQ